jgi:predicted DsbA family dithiol-disulfide isomerase
MESWVVGFDGDADVERHSGAVETPTEEDLTPRVGRALPLRLRVVSDYICPWGYIGLTRLERLRDEFAVELDVGAFELRPGLPPEGLPRDQVYANRVYPPGYLDNMRQTAREAGIDMKRPPLIPNTRKAHEATEAAKEAGVLLPFHRSVFRAYWEDEENIGDMAVLCRIAAECGLDASELRAALDVGRFATPVQEEIDWSRAAGITGVPTFIFNEKFSVVGAQEYEVFRDIARRIVEGRITGE